MLLVLAELWSVDVRGEGRKFRRLQVESYALRIVIESGSVNLTAYNLESDWLNLDGPRSIPGADSDLRHGRGASRRPRTVPAASERCTPAARTVIPGEDCAFLQMTEVPPKSSANAVLVSTFSISPQPHTLPKVTRLATFQSRPPSPVTPLPPDNQP